MNIFWKAVAGVLIAVIACLFLSKQNKDISALLAVGVCCIVAAAAMAYLEPVFDFFNRLQSIGQLDSDALRILMKCTGIGIVTEIAGLVCEDAGNAALGKSLKLLACGAILWLAIPLLEALLDLLDAILVNI